MNQNEIVKTIEEYNTKQGGTVSSFSIPLHRHNGSDSNKINLSDTNPFTFVDDTPSQAGILGQQFNYSFGVDIPYDYGIMSYMGGTWNTISYYSSGVNASLSTDQTLPNNSSDIVVFDTISFDDSGEYDPTTGKYTLRTTGEFLISAQITTDCPAVLNLLQDNGSGSIVVNSSHGSGTGIISISSTQIRKLGLGVTFWFEVSQFTGSPKTLFSVDTFLSVKKFMS